MKVALDNTIHEEMSKNERKSIKIGSKLGPIELVKVIRDKEYSFHIDAFFINCFTGYSLIDTKNGTLLSLDVLCENPRFRDKIFWILAKPFHAIFANKVLKTLKNEIEEQILKNS